MKFLDGDGLARVWAKIKQTFAYKTDIKSSDWNASEGEDGYIENRTHYFCSTWSPSTCFKA